MLHQTREGKRRAVSPVIATLLLIAIAVAAAIVLYIFVSGLTGSLTQSGGQQVAEQISMDAYSFPCTNGSCSTLGFTLRNVGSTTVTLSAVYFDGTLVTLASGSGYTCTASATLTTSGTTQTCSGSIAFGSPNPAAPTPGTSHILKVTTQTGGVFTFTVIAGRSG